MQSEGPAPAKQKRPARRSTARGRPCATSARNTNAAKENGPVRFGRPFSRSIDPSDTLRAVIPNRRLRTALHCVIPNLRSAGGQERDLTSRRRYRCSLAAQIQGCVRPFTSLRVHTHRQIPLSPLAACEFGMTRWMGQFLGQTHTLRAVSKTKWAGQVRPALQTSNQKFRELGSRPLSGRLRLTLIATASKARSE